MVDTEKKLVELLAQAGQAHHQAFVEQDGEDPEWPLWYAQYLQEPLSELLAREFTTSELVYLFLHLHRSQPLEAPDQPWTHYYARYLARGASAIAAETLPVDVPYISTAQMIEVDRAMMEDYHIELMQMMENAGRNLAHLARQRFLAGDPRGRHVVVLAGTGGNGGGALVAARRLHNWGADVDVFVTKHVENFTPVPAHQYQILEQMGISLQPAAAVTAVADVDVILDGIIGYSLKGAPRATAADLVRWANAQSAPVLALDAPSGVDATTGSVFDPAIKAVATLTLALPKAGLTAAGVAQNVGELYLADISVPPGLYASGTLDLSVGPVFARNEILRLR